MTRELFLLSLATVRIDTYYCYTQILIWKCIYSTLKGCLNVVLNVLIWTPVLSPYHQTDSCHSW